MFKSFQKGDVVKMVDFVLKPIRVAQCKLGTQFRLIEHVSPDCWIIESLDGTISAPVTNLSDFFEKVNLSTPIPKSLEKWLQQIRSCNG